MNKSKYPKRFEILQNDGEILKFRDEELASGISEYFVKHCINDID